MDKDYDTITYLLNQGVNSTTITPAFLKLLADPFFIEGISKFYILNNSYIKKLNIFITIAFP